MKNLTRKKNETAPEHWHRVLSHVTGELSYAIVKRVLVRKQVFDFSNLLAAVQSEMVEFAEGAPKKKERKRK